MLSYNSAGFRPRPIPRGGFSLRPAPFLGSGYSLLANRLMSDSPEVHQFEDTIAAMTGRRHAIALGSGKIALGVILEELSLPRGSQIVLPGFLVPEVVAVVLASGLEPVIVDVDPETFNIDVDRLEEAINPRTKAVLAVHLFGTPCDMDAIDDLASRHGLAIIEDAAQGLGASIGGRPIGSFGEASYLSLGLYKNLNTLVGGVVLTDNDGLAAEIRDRAKHWKCPSRRELLIEWARWGGLATITHPLVFGYLAGPVIQGLESLRPGWIRDAAHSPDPEYCSPNLDLQRFRVAFSDLQARLGMGQMVHMERQTLIRRRNATILDEVLSGMPDVTFQRVCGGCRSIRLNYPVVVKDRQRLLPALRTATGLDLAPGYLRCLASIPAFEGFCSPTPVAEALEQGHFYVPIHQDLPVGEFRRSAIRLAETLNLLLQG